MGLTVAVSPKDANKLINAQKASTLNVTLCSHKAESTPVYNEDDSITRRDLLGLSEIPAPPKPYTIEKWEAGHLKKIQLSNRHREVNQSVAAPAKSNEENTSVQNRSQQVQPKISGPQL